MRYALVLVFAVACGSSSTPSSPSPDAGSSGGGTADRSNLAIKNFESQCAIAINSGPAELGANLALILNAAGPNTITLTASPAGNAFALGPAPWHRTDGDTGSGEAGTIAGTGTTETSSTTITIANNSSACVWVCCPLADGTGCPATDQCL